MLFRLTVTAYVVAVEIAPIVYFTIASYCQAAFRVSVLKNGIGRYNLCIYNGSTKDA